MHQRIREYPREISTWHDSLPLISLIIFGHRGTIKFQMLVLYSLSNEFLYLHKGNQ